MNVDNYLLPQQANGDRNDQLQRCGMLAVAAQLNPEIDHNLANIISASTTALYREDRLQPKSGVFVRYTGGDPDNVSADQLIAALCAFVQRLNKEEIRNLFVAMAKRFGFAQNKKDGLNADTRTKIPDFMALRALPLFFRYSKFLYPLTYVVDVLLVIGALLAVGPVFHDNKLLPSRRSPDDVDDNNTFLTLLVCRTRMPTLLSMLAVKIYAKLRPWNYGCREETVVVKDKATMMVTNNSRYKPVYGALRWYHRAESGGNPEVAEVFAPLCKRYFK